MFAPSVHEQLSCFQPLISSAAPPKHASPLASISAQFAALTNKAEEFYIHKWISPQGTAFQLDWWAFGWCTLLTGLLIVGTKESAMFNTVMTVVHVILVVFIIIAGE